MKQSWRIDGDIKKGTPESKGEVSKGGRHGGLWERLRISLLHWSFISRTHPFPLSPSLIDIIGMDDRLTLEVPWMGIQSSKIKTGTI